MLCQRPKCKTEGSPHPKACSLQAGPHGQAPMLTQDPALLTSILNPDKWSKQLGEFQALESSWQTTAEAQWHLLSFSSPFTKSKDKYRIKPWKCCSVYSTWHTRYRNRTAIQTTTHSSYLVVFYLRCIKTGISIFWNNSGKETASSSGHGEPLLVPALPLMGSGIKDNSLHFSIPPPSLLSLPLPLCRFQPLQIHSCPLSVVSSC